MEEDGLSLVKNLINTHCEKEWWDFKREHHRDKAALVHDITCMANTCTNRDCYIIFGVEDGTFSICGVEHDDNRRNQQNIVDILRSVNYAGGVRPRIEMRTIELGNHEIDVLIVKNTHDVPYYLTKPYQDDKVRSLEGKKIGKTVLPFHIYTRVVDTNTPINGHADINHVEYLWRKRFGIDLPPKERLLLLLDDIDKWNCEWGKRDYAYHSDAPEFQIKQIGMLEKARLPEPAAYFYACPEMYVAKIYIMYHSTILYETEMWTFDEMRKELPKASSFMVPGRWGFRYYYYLLDTIDGKLFNLFTKGTLDASSRVKDFHQFLIFSDSVEKQSFDTYLNAHFDAYTDEEISNMFRFQLEADVKYNSGDKAFSAFSIAKCAKLYEDWKQHPEFSNHNDNADLESVYSSCHDEAMI